MQIVNLKRDKLHLKRVILSDGNEVLIDNDVCYERALKVGLEIDSGYLKELLLESEYTRAKARAIWYLDRSAYTEKGLYDKLVKAGFKKEACAKVVARFIEVGLLDDESYARNYAERLMSANISKREAVQKMLSKGVPYDLVKAVLDETETDEHSQIQNLLERKYRSKLLRENGVRKVYEALVRKGFSYSVVKSVLKSYIEESEDEYV